jgi:hypothetical protein
MLLVGNCNRTRHCSEAELGQPYLELMQLKLPQTAHCSPCFKTDTQVYLVTNKAVYSFTPPQINRTKTLSQHILCNDSYYIRDTLYYIVGGAIQTLVVGRLNS